MHAASLSIDGEPGYLFEAMHCPDVVVFVPAAVLSDRYDDVAECDMATYITSGWATRNARFNSGDTSDFAFPVLDGPMLRADDHRVALFLRRLRHAYTVELVAN